jgi:hypothetical protein
MWVYNKLITSVCVNVELGAKDKVVEKMKCNKLKRKQLIFELIVNCS